jgi:hypothetical protein
MADVHKFLDGSGGSFDSKVVVPARSLSLSKVLPARSLRFSKGEGLMNQPKSPEGIRGFLVKCVLNLSLNQDFFHFAMHFVFGVGCDDFQMVQPFSNIVVVQCLGFYLTESLAFHQTTIGSINAHLNIFYWCTQLQLEFTAAWIRIQTQRESVQRRTTTCRVQ